MGNINDDFWTNSLSIIMFEKMGNVKSTIIKDYKEADLYKKCGFKKPDHFVKQAEWNIPYEGNNYTLTVYGKKEGRANTENKYEFPPTTYSRSLYNTCVLLRVDGNNKILSLTCDIWLELYKKIIEGFNQGDTTDDDDEDKDDVGDEEFDEDIEGGDGCIECVNSDEECETEVDLCAKKVLLNDIGLEELENYYGSELEEEAYSYSDEE